MSIENQRIFLAPRKDLGVGGWGLDNPYGVRILNPLEIIGQSLTRIIICHNKSGPHVSSGVESL